MLTSLQIPRQSNTGTRVPLVGHQQCHVVPMLLPDMDPQAATQATNDLLDQVRTLFWREVAGSTGLVRNDHWLHTHNQLWIDIREMMLSPLRLTRGAFDDSIKDDIHIEVHNQFLHQTYEHPGVARRPMPVMDKVQGPILESVATASSWEIVAQLEEERGY